ncbi:MAG: glycerophosphodiester phosphodiesterase family protein [Rubricella sp.]
MTPELDPAFLARPIAHRALHGQSRPENSRAAVEAAVAGGWGIEVDVQISRDGVPLVFHDYQLDRLTNGQGAVAALDLAALHELRLKGSDETIPTLEEIAGIVAGRVPLLVEIKDQDGALGPAVGRLEEAVGRVLAGYSGPLAVMSFNPNAVRVMQEHLPHVPRGIVTDAFRAENWPLVPPARRARLALIPDIHASGASFISHNRRFLESAPVLALKARGLSVLTWTVRSAAEAEEAYRVADQITFEGFLPG